MISGAFYPNYFSWSAVDEARAQKEMSGHDPAVTVMVSDQTSLNFICLVTCTCSCLQLGGLPPNPERFSKVIAHMFNDCGRGQRLHFEQSK